MYPNRKSEMRFEREWCCVSTFRPPYRGIHVRSVENPETPLLSSLHLPPSKQIETDLLNSSTISNDIPKTTVEI